MGTFFWLTRYNILFLCCLCTIANYKFISINITYKKSYTVETSIKEPVFIRALRLKFNLLNPLNENSSEAESGRSSYMYMKGFMSSEFLRIFKNSRHSDQNSSAIQKAIRSLNKNSNLNMFSRILQNFQKLIRILVLKNSIDVCNTCTVYKKLLRTLQAGIYNNGHVIKNLFRLPKKTLVLLCGFLLYDKL